MTPGAEAGHYLTTRPPGCTCRWSPSPNPLEHPDTEWNPGCPKHGAEHLDANGRPLDIDTSYQREERTQRCSGSPAQTSSRT